MHAKPTGRLTSLPDLVAEYGRDKRYWSGYVDGMGLPTFRGENNSKAIDERGKAKLDERLRGVAPRGHAEPRMT